MPSSSVETPSVWPVTIIGSGPAGYTAAIYAARAGLAPLLISGPQVGGQLMWTTDVENFPGFPNGIQGPELMQAMRDQAQRFGTQYKDTSVTSVEFSEDPSGAPHVLLLENGERVHTKTVIIATGASAKWLGTENEEAYKGKGVSACATCDGFFFKNKPVIVVGGGDAAMEEALFLSNICSSVTVLIRGSKEEMKASVIMKERAFAKETITFLFHTEVDEFLGDQLLERVRVKQNQTGDTQELEANGAFIAIGHTPNSLPFKDSLPVDKKGYIHPVAPAQSTATRVPGVFVAGDIHDIVYRQAVTAAGEGCKAALDAERYLQTL